jgi:hypothetical protein
MTRLVPVVYASGPASRLPLGVELGAAYTLVGPDGTRAVLNDDSDPDFVGYITDLTGLDSAEVRESADDRSMIDGGAHGRFLYGRRPVTITGVIAESTVEDRNLKITRLMRAVDAMAGDGQLSWEPTGGVPVSLAYRRQQPPRISGRVPKEFQLQVVSADPRIYAVTPSSSTAAITVTSGTAATLSCVNLGSAPSPPVITLTGPITNARIRNAPAGPTTVNAGLLKLDATITAGQQVVIDTANGTIVRVSDGANLYGKLNFSASSWWSLEAGANTVTVDSGTYGTGAAITVGWSHAWW